MKNDSNRRRGIVPGDGLILYQGMDGGIELYLGYTGKRVWHSTKGQGDWHYTRR